MNDEDKEVSIHIDDLRRVMAFVEPLLALGGQGSCQFDPDHGRDSCAQVYVSVGDNGWVTIKTTYYGGDDDRR